MLKSKKILLEKSFYNAYNPFIHLLQKTPLIGKAIPDSLYKIGALKNILIFLGLIVEIGKSLLFKTLYFLAVRFFTIKVLQTAGYEFSYKYFLNLLFIMAIAGSYKVLGYFDGDKEDYLMIKQIGIAPEDYYSNKIFTSILLDLFAYTLVFTNFLKDYGINYFDIFALICLLSASRIFFVFTFSKLSLIEKNKRDWIYLVLSLFFMSIPLLFVIITVFIPSIKEYQFIVVDLEFLTSRPLEIIYVLLLILSVYKFYKSNMINSLIEKTLRYDNFNVQIEDLQTEAYRVKEEDLDFEKEEVSTDYKGIDYINRIFFKRLKRPFSKSSRNRTIVVALSGIALILIIYFTGVYREAEFIDYLGNTMPLISFLLGLFVYMGDRFTRLCFFNMDRWLMKYNFYRKPSILRQSILIRFKYMIKFNLPILIVLILISSGMLLLIGASRDVYILNFVFSILGMMFFNFHYLFMYYLFQPFTEGLKEKSFGYSILNVLAYYIIINALKAFSEIGTTLYYIIGIFVLIYIIIGFISVRLFAHKRFKLQ